MKRLICIMLMLCLALCGCAGSLTPEDIAESKDPSPTSLNIQETLTPQPTIDESALDTPEDDENLVWPPAFQKKAPPINDASMPEWMAAEWLGIVRAPEDVLEEYKYPGYDGYEPALYVKVKLNKDGTGTMVTAHQTIGLSAPPSGNGLAELRVIGAQDNIITVAWDNWVYPKNQSPDALLPQSGRMTLEYCTLGFQVDWAEYRGGLWPSEEVYQHQGMFFASGTIYDEALVGYVLDDENMPTARLYMPGEYSEANAYSQNSLRVVLREGTNANGRIHTLCNLGKYLTNFGACLFYTDSNGYEHMRYVYSHLYIVEYNNGMIKSNGVWTAATSYEVLDNLVFAEGVEFGRYEDGVAWINLFELDAQTDTFINANQKYPDIYEYAYDTSHPDSSIWKYYISMGASVEEEPISFFASVLPFLVDEMQAGRFAASTKEEIYDYIENHMRR